MVTKLNSIKITLTDDALMMLKHFVKTRPFRSQSQAIEEIIRYMYITNPKFKWNKEG